MINQIKLAYGVNSFSSCTELHTTSFYLKDPDAGKCQTSNVSNDTTCLIDIPNQKDVFFIAIDECLIPQSANKKKCDVVIFDDIKIWFIELKQVQFSGVGRLDRQKKNNGRRKAVKQLASTILDFKSKGIDLSNMVVGALISFPPFINEPSPITIPSTASQTRMLEFATLCGYSDLFEGNHVVF